MRCPAKLNLSLHVLGKRGDGFSELDSVVALLDWYDDLLISDCDGDSPSHGDVHFTSNDKALEALGEDNLVLRGIRAVQQYVRQYHHSPVTFPTVDVYLEKCLPYQAGLGSASSNAAAAIRLYHDLLCRKVPTLTPLSLEELNQLGAGIGSDVPLFLREKSVMHMQGRGERIQPIDRPVSQFQDATLLILKAEHIAISTKDAYAWVHEVQAYSTPDPHFLDALQKGHPLKGLTSYMHNDFEDVILERHPELRGMKNALLDAGAFHAMLCGSGSAVVGFFDHDKMPSSLEQSHLATSLGAKLWQTTFL
ncbi:MAG: 4-(cytidine 5'-diphospho)-2-C-methyl-D-erythritol kinase [Vampirovibrionales bacterium]